MAEAKSLHRLFEVSQRFRRSVNVAADYPDDLALEGYIMTPLSRTVLQRVAQALAPEATGRAYSITGPYGAGKSACALFMAKVLGYPVRPRIRRMVIDKDPELWEELTGRIHGLAEGGFWVAPIVGSREPLTWTLLAGLLSALRAVMMRSPALTRHVEAMRALYAQLKRGEAVPEESITGAIEQSAALLRAENPAILGMLLIYDELGKSLEYAAYNPEVTDIGILQAIAERAARSRGAVVGVVTVLHQGFEHYAAALSIRERSEWRKIQGRFEDIGFLASAGEVLNLVSQAIRPVARLGSLERLIAAEARQAETLQVLPRDLNVQDALTALARCAPLHPTVALLLGSLFRGQLAQNERSLFAFLSSSEPRGFQEFLHQEAWSDNGYRPFYRLDRLYDYVVAALGSGLYRHTQGKRWAEINDALARLPKEAGAVEARLVKAIGLLGLLGDQRYLRASEEVLSYAVADGCTTPEEVAAALKELEGWGIVIYRRFKRAYGLWEGSDIDLEERLQRGLAQIDRSQNLAQLLEHRGYIKPYVAKRHLHETGTLRYLLPRVVEFDELPEALQRPAQPADGVLIFVLAASGRNPEETARQAAGIAARPEYARTDPTFLAVPRHAHGLREALEELQAWEWVEKHTPELEGDRIARQELAERRLAARTRLGRAVGRTFDMAFSYRSCLWICDGQERRFASARELAAALSTSCRRAYSAAPVVKNELLNRSTLSSAAAAARRNLIELMLTCGQQGRLGLERYPAELSMYLAVLERSGLHEREGDNWCFGPPPPDDPCHVLPLWQGIESFFASTEEGPRPIAELFSKLRQPPYGVREGLWPVYLAAAFLSSVSELALYERGSFVPHVDAATWERLIKVPQQFTIQRCRLGDLGRLTVRECASMLGLSASEPSTLDVVRPLLGLVRRLPPYARDTRRLQPATLAVREALLTAHDPHRLLFQDLPRVLGQDPEAVQSEVSGVKQFVAALRAALRELQGAYDTLLEGLAAQLADAFRLPEALEAARGEIAHRAQRLGAWVADLRLKALLTRLADAKLNDQEWLESVSAGLANKPLKQWNDGDVLRFGVALAELSAQFRRVEELAAERDGLSGDGQARLLRLDITALDGAEQREVIRIRPEEEGELARTVSALEDLLHEHAGSRRLQLSAAAELARRLLAQDTTENTEKRKP